MCRLCRRPLSAPPFPTRGLACSPRATACSPAPSSSASVDEHPRSETTLEGLAKLPTVFKKDGAVTAASSSGICDGGATLLLASEEALSVRRAGKRDGRMLVGCWSACGALRPAPVTRTDFIFFFFFCSFVLILENAGEP